MATYSLLQELVPVLAPSLTHLSFTATPPPRVQQLEQLAPADYGVHLLTRPGCLPSLRSLQLYVMPRHAWLLDCGQLRGLTALTSLRSLDLESPITGATRLVRLTALADLTHLTQLVTGRLDDECFSGRVLLGGMSSGQREQALAWLSSLVAGRFGPLPREAAPLATGAGLQHAYRPEEDSDEEDGPCALVGSDVEVTSDDLVAADSGDEESSEAPEYAEDGNT